MQKQQNIVIFASGNGSNALNIIQYFKNKEFAQVACVFCNKKNAGVIQKALDNKVAVQLFDKDDFYKHQRVINLVQQYNPSIIVLAGFLWLIPENFIQAFENKIINLHPSLLPNYGGKGMYGNFVHEAVLKNKEKETGITIHLVNKEYDKGEILFQAKCKVAENDTIESLSAKIHDLEHNYLPSVIESFLLK